MKQALRKGDFDVCLSKGNAMNLSRLLVVLPAKLVALGLLVLVAAGFPQGKRGQGQPSVFYTDVPDHPADVILTRPTTTAVTLSILAYKDTDAVIAYGTEKGHYSRKTGILALGKGVPAEMVLPSLAPNTQYFYRLNRRDPGAADFIEGEECTFHTARPAGSDFVFAVQADSHLDENCNSEVYARTLANVADARPDFFVDLGDTFMTDKHRPNFRDAARQYLAQRYYFGLVCKSAPMFMALGNHDGEAGWQSGGAADSMSGWSIGMRKKCFPNPVPDSFYSGNKASVGNMGLLQDYYAWEWGDALFVVLDPFWYTRTSPTQDGDGWAWSLGADQYTWLKQTLERSRVRFKFVFIHHLVGGSTPEARGGAEAAKYFEWGGSDLKGNFLFGEKRPGWEMPIHALLVQNKVNIVFHGHDHLFAKQELDGVVYQLVPQPGSRRFDNTRSATDYGYVHGDILSAPGMMRVAISKDKATVDYIRTYLPAEERDGRNNGQVGHSYTIAAAAK